MLKWQILDLFDMGADTDPIADDVAAGRTWLATQRAIAAWCEAIVAEIDGLLAEAA